jgi:hypothetical protein
MATYKEIKGVTVQTLDSDPELNVGAWAAGGALNTAKQHGGGAGTQTAGLAFGSFPTSATTESYNGSSWTETGDLNTAGGYFAGSFGTYTAAIGAGRLTSPTGRSGITESFDGTSWTEVADLNTTRTQGAGFGTSTAGYAAGGGVPSVVNNVESWNGSAWTETTEINTARYEFDGNGISTSGLVYGGSTHPDYLAITESWDGSSWTEVGDLNTGRQSNQGAGTSNSNALCMGGYTGTNLANTESWNGSSWTEVADLANARRGASGQGPSNTTAMLSGGNPSLTVTEEWSFPPPTSSILTEGQIFLSGGTTLKGFGKAAGVPAGTWSSGGALNTARGQAGAAGVSQDSAMVSSGRNLGPTTAGTNLCEQYNGSSWTEVAENNTARSALSGGGTQTANFIAGGRQSPPSGLGNTEIWNGSGWTEVSDLNTGRAYVTGNGTQTAGMIAGGGPPTTAKVELWDGSSWTETTDLNTAKIYRSLFGGSATPTAAVCVGGENPQIGNSETWNGSSWTEGNDLNTARGSSGVAGTSTFGLVFGGQYDSGYYAQTEVYNGTSYTELADLSTANGYTVPANNSPNVSALAAGGFTPSVGTATEEWTADAALSTITVS